MGLFEIARSAFVQWVNRNPRRHWGAWVDAFALTVDAISELADLARAAALPGQVDSNIAPNFGGYLSTDALRQYIAPDRMVVAGLAEPMPSLALRCRRYRDDWRNAGGPFAILDQLAGVLASAGQPAPLMRIVTGAGRWWTRHPDGTIRLQTPTFDGFYLAPDGTGGIDDTVAHAWDWDSVTSPPTGDQGDATRFWIIVYPPAASPYLTTDGGLPDSCVVDCGWNDRFAGTYGSSPWAATCGTNAPITLVESIRAVIQQRRCAGFRCAYIVIAFDAASFNPDGSSTGTNPYPDGHWGHHSKYDPITSERVPARLATAEYMPAEPGGFAP